MYKPKYNAVSQMKGNKKVGLAHSNSIAMTTDPKERVAKKDGGTVEIKRSTVEAAKAKIGYFTDMPEFKGELMKENGRVYGYKSHEGKFTKATNPVDVKKATAQYEYDKKLYEKKKSDKASRTERMSTPVDKESEK